MEHSAIHMLHAYQLSQEITSRLQKHLDIVTLCITYWVAVPMASRPESQNHASELRKYPLARQIVRGPAAPAKCRPSAGQVPAKCRASAGQVTCATSIRCGEGVADSRRDTQACPTMSHYVITQSSLGDRRARVLAGRREPAGDDERLQRRPPPQGRARDHAVTVNGGRAFSQRTLTLCAKSH